MGKSEVADVMRSVGVPVFDSDAEVHKLYDGEHGARLVGALVPEAVLGNKVDRMILSRHVLADPILLAELEHRVHREIRTRRDEFIQQQSQNQADLVVLDIPLLFETGSQDQVDETLVVSSLPELQMMRAMARPGMTAQKLQSILQRQMPDVDKRKKADYIIENNGSKEDLQKAVLTFLHKQNYQIAAKTDG